MQGTACCASAVSKLPMLRRSLSISTFAMPSRRSFHRRWSRASTHAGRLCRQQYRRGASGLLTKRYHQEAYATCLDLGEAGAIFALGWDRKLKPVGAEAKKAKQEINTGWIYPPRAGRSAALASADPEHATEL